MKNILITGGAGFIGSHLADELLECGYRVRVLDNLSVQVHGPAQERPAYLSPDVELQIGDVRDTVALERSLEGIDAVFHFAAMVGVGQSMYQVVKYTDTNNLGTAFLLEALASRPVERLVVASSMSVYGEGLYVDEEGKPCKAMARTLDQLRSGDWEVKGEEGQTLFPVATSEEKRPALASVYALSKYDQERLCLIMGAAYSIPTVALRFFNVYGPRQALSNPYTGVLAIFASRYLNGNPPSIFEDGNQKRDFINVRDVAVACRQALESPHAPGHAMNIGSGNNYTVSQIASRMAAVLGKTSIQADISGKYRVGDIRHCFADITLAEKICGFKPGVSLEDGLAELAGWLDSQCAKDRFAEASMELSVRGLTI